MHYYFEDDFGERFSKLSYETPGQDVTNLMKLLLIISHPDLDRIKLGAVEGAANSMNNIAIILVVLQAQLPAITTEQDLLIYHPTKIQSANTLA